MRPKSQPSTASSELARPAPHMAAPHHWGDPRPEGDVRIDQVHEQSCMQLRMTRLRASCLDSLATAPSIMWPWQEVRGRACWEAGALSMLWDSGWVG